MARQLLFEIESDVLRLDDRRIDAFRKGFIDEVDLKSMIRSDDPFGMVDGRMHYFTKEERTAAVKNYVDSTASELRKYGGLPHLRLRDLKDVFLKAYPEATPLYGQIEHEIKTENCPSCAQSHKYQKIHDFIINLPPFVKCFDQGGIIEVPRDLSGIERHVPPLSFKILSKAEIKEEDLVVDVPKYVSRTNIPFVDDPKKTEVADYDPTLDSVERKQCWDCVKKHLADAIALLSECLLGYGADKHEQKWEAIGHLSQAAKECAKLDQEFAGRIRALRVRVVGQKPEIENA